MAILVMPLCSELCTVIVLIVNTGYIVFEKKQCRYCSEIIEQYDRSTWRSTALKLISRSLIVNFSPEIANIHICDAKKTQQTVDVQYQIPTVINYFKACSTLASKRT